MADPRELTPFQPTAEFLETVTPEDVADFRRLLPQLTTKELTPEQIAQNLEAVVGSPNSKIAVIRDTDRHIQATTTGTLVRKPTGTEGWVDDVVTDEDHRGQGFGLLLLAAVHDWFAESGASSSNLTSNPTREDAWRLYERVGYERRDTGVFRLRLAPAIGSLAAKQ